MKDIGILGMEAVVAGLIAFAGLSDKRILFIHGPRSAVITLGVIGILMCTISVGKFISAAPTHPLTLAGYFFGAVAMMAFLSQVFRWGIPVIGDPRLALYILAGCIIVKGIIGRFVHMIH